MATATTPVPTFAFDERVKLANPELYAEFETNSDIVGKITTKRAPATPGGVDRYAVIWEGDVEAYIHDADELVSVDND